MVCGQEWGKPRGGADREELKGLACGGGGVVLSGRAGPERLWKQGRPHRGPDGGPAKDGTWVSALEPVLRVFGHQGRRGR